MIERHIDFFLYFLGIGKVDCWIYSDYVILLGRVVAINWSHWVEVSGENNFVAALRVCQFELASP